MSLSAGQLALIRTEQQFSKVSLGFLIPKTVFACQINDTFTTNDRTVQFTYDNVTSGVYTDVIVGQTCFIGTTPGAYDVGICRVRTAFTSSIAYIGETAEIDFDDNLYATVIDAFDPWARHVAIVSEVAYMDYDITYSDQHENFDPVPIMGGQAVVDVESYPVAIDFPDVANCYVYDSSISSRSFTATDGVVTNGTSTNPTLTISSYPTDGYIRVKLSVTAANGKSYDGYRYVLVFDTDHRPITDMTVGSCSCHASEGGWSARVTLNDETDIALIRERGLAIIFSKDYYGGTSDVVGMNDGRENIWMAGWVYQHRDQNDPEFSPNEFEIYTAHFWLNQMTGFAPGVEMATDTPAAWTEIAGLTVDRGIWHLLHWRSTMTIIMDVYLTGDTKYTREASAPSPTIWQQILETAQNQILAVPRCGYNASLYVKVPYNLIPEADRSTDATLVMALTTADYTKTTQVQWTSPRVSWVNMSGVKVNAGGGYSTYFSLSPGHTPGALGQPLVQDNMLLESQTQSNTLAGLLYSARNNPYPNIPITLKGINRAFDIAPIQYATIALDEFTGNVIPIGVEYQHDHSTGKTEIQVTFEAETVTGLNINGDIPLTNTTTFTPPSIPKIKPLPPLSLPPYSPIVPSGESDVDNGPSTVIMGTSNKGIVYTTTFNTTSPVWIPMNEGLEDLGYENSGYKFLACPSGLILVQTGAWYTFELFWAEGPGAVWQGPVNTSPYYANAIGVNPFQYEQFAFTSGANGALKIYIGDRNSQEEGGSLDLRNERASDLHFLENKWIFNGCRDNFLREAAVARWGADGSAEYLDTKPDNVGGSVAQYWAVISGEDEVAEYGSHSGLGFYSDLLGTITGDFDSSDSFKVNLQYGSLASDPTGQFMIGGAGGSSPVKRSNDYGRTFAAAPGINVGYHCFANCDSPNSFIAATTQDVRYTPDWGSTWANKSGNLAYAAPLGAPRYIQFVSW